MRVNVEKPYTLAEMKPKLEAAFPEYKVKFRGPKVLVISQGNIAGAMIVGEKQKFARVQEAFPTMGGQLLFMLSILLLGVLIPSIVFLTAFKPKQVKVRDAVADFIRTEYGSGIASSSSAKTSEALLDAGI
jgi:hypothetical protein